MKDFWNWIVKNFSNLFTVLGILLTLYFSIFYVPSYIKENENDRNKSINVDLVETMQEIVYNNHEFSEDKINSLIKGKELKYNIHYQYNIEELIIQTEEAFLSNKFIPFEQRINLVNRLDSIKTKIKPIQKVDKSSTSTKSFFNSSDNFNIILSMIAGILTSFLGSLSFLFRIRKEKKQFIDSEVEKEKDGIQEQIVNDMNFENMIADILSKNNLNYEKIFGKDTGFDFVVRINNNKRIFVSTKYMSSGRSLNMDGIKTLTFPFKRNNEHGVIILNKADNRLIFYLNDFSKEVDNRVKLIISSNIEEIEIELLKFINNFR